MRRKRLWSLEVPSSVDSSAGCCSTRWHHTQRPGRNMPAGRPGIERRDGKSSGWLLWWDHLRNKREYSPTWYSPTAEKNWNFRRSPGTILLSFPYEKLVDEDANGSLVEWYWQGKTEVLGEKHYTAWVVGGWMSMEQWWNDTDRGKLKYWEKNIIQCGW